MRGGVDLLKKSVAFCRFSVLTTKRPGGKKNNHPAAAAHGLPMNYPVASDIMIAIDGRPWTTHDDPASD
jgi:hypothetical protein